jgi:hypothetical protein
MKNMNVNADFLLDIWADLKAKRLAPVAIGLVVIAIAMPALMLRGEDSAVEGPLPIAAPVAAQGAKVELAEDLADGSKLDSYKARDPFAGMKKPAAAPAAGSGAASAPSDLLAEAAKDKPAQLPAMGGGSGGSSGLDEGPSPTPGSDPNFSPTPAPVIVKKPGARYNYQLDLRVGRLGREKRYPHVSRLSFLPSASLPALLFMGVTEDEKHALFFVHPGLSHQGQGLCLPSNEKCNFVKLKIGQEHFLSANDYEFHVKLLGIDRVKLSAEKAEREQVRKASGSHRRSTGEGTTGAPAEEQFEMPLLVDGIG